MLPALFAVLGLLPISLFADLLASGSGLEVRLLTPVGSRVSHAGDSVQAVTIAPVVLDRRLVIPQGASVSGVVVAARRVGLGLRHETASIELQFNRLRLPGGALVPVETRVWEVETAKEKVSPDGIIGGIHPAANLSNTLSYYVLPVLCIDPAFGLPILGVKALIARSPDPEIYFPAGTEILVRLSASIEIPEPDTLDQKRIPSLSATDVATAYRLLDQLPHNQTDRGPDHPSDLLNILFLGTQDQITRAFRAAGWVGAQDRSLLTIYRMYHSMVQRSPYTMAPMGRLTLNGLVADQEFQKSLNTFSKRHHFRLWRQSSSDAWFSAATEDISYHFRQMHLTHASDNQIDNERAKVVNDLAFTGCLGSATMISRHIAYPPEHEGVSIKTDGKIAVVRMNDCLAPTSMPTSATQVSPREPNRLRQVAQAFQIDMLRSNPVSLLFNARRIVARTEQYERNSFRSRRTAAPQTAGQKPLDQNSGAEHWTRASVLDTAP